MAASCTRLVRRASPTLSPQAGRGCGQFHQRRQGSGQRLAAPVGAISSAERSSPRLLQQRQLMFARRPAAHGEPAQEMIGQQVGFGDGFTGRHASELGTLSRHCEVKESCRATFP